jgi:hypothetical protein
MVGGPPRSLAGYRWAGECRRPFSVQYNDYRRERDDAAGPPDSDAGARASTSTAGTAIVDCHDRGENGCHA